MKTRYQESQIEDVAQILKSQISSALPLNWVGHIAETETNATVKRLAHRFADLFAADNPPTCIECGAHRDETDPEGQCVNHLFAYGFDREQFLEACGLKETS
ncbi:MAG: hypothetical protein V3W37_08700 [Candidatus Binatia bacterium]